MKRVFTSGILAAAVLLIAGCVGLQTNRIPVNIGFKPLIGHDTRAAVESVPFPEDRSFKVWGLNEGNGSLHLEAETVSYRGGWIASKTWPQAEVSFEACWPEDLGVSYSKKDGLSLKEYDCTAGDVDILFARTGNEEHEIDSLVTLRFDHILSRVEFRMLQSLSSEMQVKLHKIELVGFAQKGDYNADGEYTWKPAAADGSFTVFDAGENPVDLTSDAEYFGPDFYTIPQHCTAAVKVSFEVRFGEAAWIPQEETIPALDTEWKPSTHYTYTLNLTEKNLVYTTGISSWNNR